MIVLGLMWIGSAGAVHDNGMFELDGNTVNNGSAVYDWNDLFDASGNRLITPDPINGPLLADTFVSDRKRFRARSPVARVLEAIDRRAFRTADVVVADTAAHARVFA